MANFRIAEVQESWDEDFLKSYGIEKVGSVFLFDTDEVTYIASTQPSYYGRFLYYNVYTKFEQGSEDEASAYEAVCEEPGEDDYFSNIPDGVDVVEDIQEGETYDELIEFVTEHYRSNCVV